MYLSSDLNRHDAHADPFAIFRDEASASHNNPVSPFILTNGPGANSAPPTHDPQESTPVHARIKDRWEAAHNLPRFPVKLSFKDKRLRPHAERDWVLGMLRDVAELMGVKWESLGEIGFWKWFSALKRQLQHAEAIEDNSFKRFRELDFLSCGAWSGKGTHIKYADGSECLSVYSCSETACTRCADRNRRRTALKLFKKIMAASAVQNLKRFWGIVITLPKQFERLPVAGSQLRQALVEAIQKYLRKLFGLKTRDGLFAYCNIHAVGDENLFRDRFHFHCGVLPIAVRKTKGCDTLIHCDFKSFKIDLERAKSLLADYLEQVLPGYERELTQVNFKPFILKNEKKYTNKLLHRLKYDLRGFGKDIEQAPIFFAPAQKLVVIKQGMNGYGVFTFQQMAERWRWIREQRCRLRTWGLLHQWNKYLDLLKLEHIKDPEPEIVGEKNITIIRSGGRQWNPKKRRVEWVHEKMAIDGDGAIIHGVKWGRKGSEGNWQPKDSSSPKTKHQPPQVNEKTFVYPAKKSPKLNRAGKSSERKWQPIIKEVPSE